MISASFDIDVWLKFLGILAILAVAYFVVVGWISRIAHRSYSVPCEAEEIRRGVAALPLNSVVEEALPLLSDRSKFSSSPFEKVPDSIDAALGPTLVEFFHNHGRMTCLIDELKLALDEPVHWEHDRSFIKIGRRTVHVLLLAKEKSDGIYEWETDIPEDIMPLKEQMESLVAPHYPSVYHLIVAVHREWVQRRRKK